VDHLAPSSDRCDHLRPIFLIQLLYRVVARDDEGFMLQWYRRTLRLTLTCVTIHPDLEEVAQTRIVMVVEQDCLLGHVAVPPLVLILQIDICVVISRIARFAYTRLPPDPDTSAALCLDCNCCCNLISIQVLLKIEISLNPNQTLFDGLLRPHFNQR